MASDAQKRAAEKYHREKMDTISIRSKKADKLPERIKAAAALHGIPPARYIRNKIEAGLKEDGFAMPDGPE